MTVESFWFLLLVTSFHLVKVRPNSEIQQLWPLVHCYAEGSHEYTHAYTFCLIVHVRPSIINAVHAPSSNPNLNLCNQIEMILCFFICKKPSIRVGTSQMWSRLVPTNLHSYVHCLYSDGMPHAVLYIKKLYIF